jgi:hypothetical protein
MTRNRLYSRKICESQLTSSESGLFTNESDSRVGQHFVISGIRTRATIGQIQDWIAVDDAQCGIGGPHPKVAMLAPIEGADCVILHMLDIPTEVLIEIEGSLTAAAHHSSDLTA